MKDDDTTNSVQFGVLAEAFLGFDALNVSGHFQFDALFQFSPFMFDISGSAGFSVKVFGIGLYSVGLSYQLQGPTPWRVRGTASIPILFFHIDVDFDHTWGESQDTSLPPIDVMPQDPQPQGAAGNEQAERPESGVHGRETTSHFTG